MDRRTLFGFVRHPETFRRLRMDFSVGLSSDTAIVRVVQTARHSDDGHADVQIKSSTAQH